MDLEAQDLPTDARKVRKVIASYMPRRKGKIRLQEFSEKAEEIAMLAGVHVNTVRAIIRRYGDRLFKTAVVSYEPSYYSKSGGSAFGRYEGDGGRAGGVYFPATVTVARRDGKRK